MSSPWKADGEPTAATTLAITPEAIDNLYDFLVATDWRCIYGLNLGYGTPQTDLAEATYVYNKLGPRLACFQIGNEVNLFKGHLRDRKLRTSRNSWSSGSRTPGQCNERFLKHSLACRM